MHRVSHGAARTTVAALSLVLAAICTAAASESREDEVPEPAEVCISCHAVGPDEPPLEGPTLWGVVGRPVAGAPDFEYSDALRRLGGTWDRDRLDRFLAAPQSYAPGAAMTFGGVRSAADRKVVLEWLESLAPRGDD
jgi:cytochrome c